MAEGGLPLLNIFRSLGHVSLQAFLTGIQAVWEFLLEIQCSLMRIPDI